LRLIALLLALTVPAGGQAPALNLVVVEGEGQINNIKQRTARDPVVQVEDQNHKPVAGAVVVFSLPSNGASGTFANGGQTVTVSTNEQGQAVARGFRPNGVRGQFQIHVNASHNGQTASANIAQTNAVLTAAGTVAAGAGHAKLIALLAAVGAGAIGGIVYATQAGGGGGTTPAAGASPVTIGAGTGSVGPPR
jgi:hypothetical protein